MSEELGMAAAETSEVGAAPDAFDVTIVVVSHQVSCDLSGESIVLELDSGVYYGLNDVAARVWALAQSPVTLHAVVRTLLDEYDVDRDQCERDVLGLVHDLRERGLLDVREG